MIRLDFKVNLNGLDKSLESKGKQVKSKLVQLNRDIVTVAHRWVQRKAPRKTGRFKSSIQLSIQSFGGSVWHSLGIASYGDCIIDGTRPHIIMGNPYLSFKGKGGKTILGWKLKNGTRPGIVNHPGTKPNPIYDEAFPMIESEANKKIQVFEEWLTEV